MLEFSSHPRVRSVISTESAETCHCGCRTSSDDPKPFTRHEPNDLPLLRSRCLSKGRELRILPRSRQLFLFRIPTRGSAIDTGIRDNANGLQERPSNFTTTRPPQPQLPRSVGATLATTSKSTVSSTTQAASVNANNSSKQRSKKREKLCFAWAKKGQCAKGDRCPYSHDVSVCLSHGTVCK